MFQKFIRFTAKIVKLVLSELERRAFIKQKSRYYQHSGIGWSGQWHSYGTPPRLLVGQDSGIAMVPPTPVVKNIFAPPPTKATEFEVK